jgi:hypothetical protein
VLYLGKTIFSCGGSYETLRVEKEFKTYQGRKDSTEEGKDM